MLKPHVKLILKGMLQKQYFFGCFRFGNTAYLHISVAFIQMLKALSKL